MRVGLQDGRDPLGGRREVRVDPRDEVARDRSRAEGLAREAPEQVLLRERRARCGPRAGSAASAATAPSSGRSAPARGVGEDVRRSPGAPATSGLEAHVVQAPEAVADLRPRQRGELLPAVTHSIDARSAVPGLETSVAGNDAVRRRVPGGGDVEVVQVAGEHRAAVLLAGGARTCGSASPATRWSRTPAAASARPPTRASQRVEVRDVLAVERNDDGGRGHG